MRYKLIFVFIFFSSLLFCSDSFHILQNGETLYAISRKYKVPLSLLLDSNNIEDASKVKVGAKIFIPSSYVVKDGDTIYGIARSFSVSAVELMSLNRLNEFSTIKVGDVLGIPPKNNEISQKNSSQTSSSSKGNDGSKKDSETSLSKMLDDPRSYSNKKVSTSLLWPVPAKKAFYLEGKVHSVVLECNKGSVVKSITSGKVISVNVQRGFGQVVFVQSKNNHIYVYAGLDRVDVKANQMLTLNENIGKIGQEAFSGNARLYFMVYNNNKPIDPAKAPRGF